MRGKTIQRLFNLPQQMKRKNDFFLRARFINNKNINFVFIRAWDRPPTSINNVFALDCYNSQLAEIYTYVCVKNLILKKQNGNENFFKTRYAYANFTNLEVYFINSYLCPEYKNLAWLMHTKSVLKTKKILKLIK